MTDKTTAPKRIYLDIGDQELLELVRSGSLSWAALREVTWSEDNASGFGVAYVREDAAEPAGGVKTVSRHFTNELGNAIRITIEGPTSVSENILTPMEVDELRSALAGHSDVVEPAGAATLAATDAPTSGAREGAGA